VDAKKTYTELCTSTLIIINKYRMLRIQIAVLGPQRIAPLAMRSIRLLIFGGKRRFSTIDGMTEVV